MAEVMPEQQAAEGGGEAQGAGGGQFMELVGNILKGMSILGEGLEKGGAPAEMLQGLQDVMGQFEGLMSMGGGEAEAPQKGSSPIDDSQGRPVSPAGV